MRWMARMAAIALPLAPMLDTWHGPVVRIAITTNPQKENPARGRGSVPMK